MTARESFFVGDGDCTTFELSNPLSRLLLNAPPRVLKPRKEVLDAQAHVRDRDAARQALERC